MEKHNPGAIIFLTAIAGIALVAGLTAVDTFSLPLDSPPSRSAAAAIPANSTAAVTAPTDHAESQTLHEMNHSPSCAWVVRTDVMREEYHDHKWAYSPEEDRWELATKTRKAPSADARIHCSFFSEDQHRYDISKRIRDVQAGSLWHEQRGMPNYPQLFWANQCVLHVVVNQTLTPTCGLSMGEAEQAVSEIIQAGRQS